MKNKPKTLIAASVIALSALGGCSATDVLASGEEISAAEVQTSTSAVTADAVPVVSETVATTRQTNVDDGVLTFEAGKDFSVVVFSSPGLVAGETYNVYFDGSTSGESIEGLYGSDAYEPGTLVGTVTAS